MAAMAVRWDLLRFGVAVVQFIIFIPSNEVRRDIGNASIRPYVRPSVHTSVRPGDNSNTVGLILFIFGTHVPYGSRSSGGKPIFKMATRFKMVAILVPILQ